MQKQIPVLDCCTLSEYQDEELLVDRFSHYVQKHRQLIFPHRHNFYHLVLFTDGNGQHTIDFKNFNVQPWQMYFMSPGQTHAWAFEGKPEGFVINFSREYLQSFLLRPDYLDGFSFFSGHVQDGVFLLPENSREEIYAAFEKLFEQSHSSVPVRSDLVKVMLLQLLLLIDQLIVPPLNKQMPLYHYTILRNFQKLIEKHYTELRLPKDYADMLYITPNHLNAICKEYIGQQAGEVIRNRVLLEAKRLLINPDFTITEIADLLHFNDNSYFTKFFKKMMGITPEEFRKQQL